MRYAEVEQAGFDAGELAKIEERWKAMPGSSFMVVVDGAVVAAWGDVERRFMCHSMRKSFLSALYGVYVDRGEIELEKTLGELGIDEKGGLTALERRARISDLLKARSGVFLPAAYEGQRRKPERDSERPGQFFLYNNWDFNALLTIFEQEANRGVFEAFGEHFAGPLGMQDWRPSDGYYHLDREASIHPAYPFRMSARDAARFGLLFAREGLWDDQRVLSSGWVRRSTVPYSQASLAGGYGLLWWIVSNPPLDDVEMYAALGTGNQMIAVLPELDMVVVNRANTYVGEVTPRGELFQLVADLVAAKTLEPVAEPRLVPLQAPAADPRLQPGDADFTALAGTYDYPPQHLGLTTETTLTLRAEDGYLVAYSPLTGTFRWYRQEDGSWLEEDSLQTYLIETAPDGEVLGGTSWQPLVSAALLAESRGDTGRAQDLLRRAQEFYSGEVAVHAAALGRLALAGELDVAKRRADAVVERFGARELEEQVNLMGYQMMWADAATVARRLFELNSHLFPQSWNVWDSLGEALAAVGETAASIEAYERSLEINPQNGNAAEALSRLRGGDEASAEPES